VNKIYVSHRFHHIMYAAKRVLSKLAQSCTSASNDTAILMMTIKLYLTALSGYCRYSEISSEITESVINAQVRVRRWLERPEIRWDDCFGGNNGKKIKEEIKVCVYYY